MSGYKIATFDGVSLPAYDPEQDQSGGAVESSLLDSLGGVFNAHGTEQRPSRKRRIPVRGVYRGETTYLVNESGAFLVDESGTYLIAGEGPAMLRAQLDRMHAREGAWGQLVRNRSDDTTVTQWVTAQCLQVQRQTRTEHGLTVAEVTVLFETAMAAWRSSSLTTTSVASVAGPNALHVTVGGTVAVEDGVFTFTASAAVTSVRVECAAQGVDWTWTGALSSGQALVVDAGAQTVTAAGANAYSGFSLASVHSADGWLPLAKGANQVMATPDGTGTAKIEHYDQWL